LFRQEDFVTQHVHHLLVLVGVGLWTFTSAFDVDLRTGRHLLHNLAPISM